MVINAAAEAENKRRKIKAVVQPKNGNLRPRIFMGILGGNLSIQMYVLGSRFQDVDNKYMSEDALAEHVSPSEEAAYQDPEQQARM